MSKLNPLKIAAILVIGLLVLALGAWLMLQLPAVQDLALKRGTTVAAKRAAEPFERPEGLRVYICGSSSPLGNTGQAQACVAVITPQHFFLIDSGAGSSDNVNLLRLPMADLDGLLISHFHSDHIAEIYEVNLASWVQGRPEPLTVWGPDGIEGVVDGINTAYKLDRQYRMAHHGSDLLPPELGLLHSKTIEPGVVFDDGDLKITAYAGEHPPIHPAVGYRFDYKGRSVIVSGDSNVTDETRKIAEGADLLIHDALSLPITTALAKALKEAGQTRTSKIVTDVMEYHASTQSLIELGTDIDVDMVAFYHLVPSPVNGALENIFMRGAPENSVLTEDGVRFDLPVSSEDIIVTRP